MSLSKPNKHLPELRTVWTGTAPSDAALASSFVTARNTVVANDMLFSSKRLSALAIVKNAQDVTTHSIEVAKPAMKYTAPQMKIPSVMAMGGKDKIFRDAADSVCRQGRWGLEQTRNLYQSWGQDQHNLPKTAFRLDASMMTRPAANIPHYYDSKSVKVGGSSVLNELFGAMVSPFKSPLHNAGITYKIRPPQMAMGIGMMGFAPKWAA
ncbi:MAG: hypothetical protein RBR86_08415 [Pseudobdellovibrionaceae bacterium]|jgi:hypothetical protein|nr:hypothetical protein [Pseudobdellovibrionaceae bacterium]